MTQEEHHNIMKKALLANQQFLLILRDCIEQQKARDAIADLMDINSRALAGVAL